MGRSVLLRRSLGPALLASLLVLGGCAGVEGPEATRQSLADGAGMEEDPHAEYLCSACHEYVESSQSFLSLSRYTHPDSVSVRAPASAARCSDSGCHEDMGPREITYHSVTFPHRRHGLGPEPDGDGDDDAEQPYVEMSCAGCHGHASGTEPMTVSTDACSLCHLNKQSAGNEGECRQCHTVMDEAGRVSPTLQIPHEGLPWIDGGCIRCHYDVSRASVEPRDDTCVNCHLDEPALATADDDDAIHGQHVDVGCSSCHTAEAHRVRGMTTAVNLECAGCHLEVHQVEVTEAWPERGTCVSCHADSHEVQQRLLLGVVPGRPQADPSEKFMQGLNCSSCHITPEDGGPSLASPDEGVHGSALACQTCHLPEYDIVLEWWEEGSDARLDRVRGMISRARSRLRSSGSSDSGLAAVDSAAALVALVDSAGAVHNLTLSHRMMEDAVATVIRGYGEAGVAPERAPDLGRQPSQGLCSYCHYRIDDPWLFQDMSGEFHRKVMRLENR